MDKIIIKGGAKLQGEVSNSGSKNSILPLLFSSLLAQGKHIFHNVPHLTDVKTSCLLLEHLGCGVKWQGHTLIIKHSPLKNFKAPYQLVRQMRAGILSLGPLLARYGQAEVSLPGGCAIGIRSVDWHLKGLKTMGAHITLYQGLIMGSSRQLKGGKIVMDFPSVGATENLMMACCLAQGPSVIENSACEPEIEDLANYLNKMGAHIKGAGTPVMEIHPADTLKPSEHSILPDRIEAGTLLLAGAITKGNVSITNCQPNHFHALTEKLKTCGFNIHTEKTTVTLSSPVSFQAADIITAPYPGFPTDLQAQFMALLTQAEGMGTIKETIFENRFMHVQELVRLGANIRLDHSVAYITGGYALQGAPVTATDLRASACLILAGLAAQGESVVHRVYHLDRGYENLEKKLQALQAPVKRQISDLK